MQITSAMTAEPAGLNGGDSRRSSSQHTKASSLGALERFEHACLMCCCWLSTAPVLGGQHSACAGWTAKHPKFGNCVALAVLMLLVQGSFSHCRGDCQRPKLCKARGSAAQQQHNRRGHAVSGVQHAAWLCCQGRGWEPDEDWATPWQILK